MGYKAKQLENLQRSNVNTFFYKEVFSKAEIKELAKQYPIFSVREDSENHINCLPFYTTLEEMPDKPNPNNSWIFSNGRASDDLLVANFVCTLDEQANFECEYSCKKVPLRKMYDYPDELNFYMGDINYKPNFILKRILNYLFTYQLFGRVEGTLYSKEVGLQKHQIIIWQWDK